MEEDQTVCCWCGTPVPEDETLCSDCFWNEGWEADDDEVAD